MSTYAPSAAEHWSEAWSPARREVAAGGLPRRDAAFFDLDNTVVQGASIFHLARGLYRRRCFTGRDIATFALAQARFRVRGSERADEIETATDRALAFVRGLRQSDVIATGEQIYDEVLQHKLWSGTVELARRHVQAGQPVWLVTAAPAELAALVARRLGLTGGLGTVAEVVDGRYTGRLVGAALHGPAKADAVREVAATHGLDLAACAAYSDSSNDLPMLTAVGHPCAVNPDKRLAAHALRHGWPVTDFRATRRLTRRRAAAPAAAGAATPEWSPAPGR